LLQKLGWARSGEIGVIAVNTIAITGRTAYDEEEQGKLFNA
jgi:hypothetical protein